MKRTMSAGLLLLPGFALLISSCLEPSRESYRDMAAEEVCDEAERCGNLGNLSYEDCIIDERARFNDLWPESECSDGRINEVRYEQCLNRSRTAVCDGNVFDLLSAASECQASQVCIN